MTRSLASFEKTGHLVVADPAHEFGSVASEVAAFVAQDGFWHLEAPITRVTTPHTHIPFSASLEGPLYPSADPDRAGRPGFGAATTRRRRSTRRVISEGSRDERSPPPMVTEVRLPQWGMGMQEGTIVTWLKRVGDEVEAGEPIAEVEAANTTEELTAPVDGVLQRVLVSEGRTVPVQELLAVIAALDDVPAEDADAGDGTDGAAGGTEPSPTTERAAAAATRRQVTPRARRLATELRTDLDAVEGTRSRWADHRGRRPTGRFRCVGRRRRGDDPFDGHAGTIARRMLDASRRWLSSR